MEIPDLAFKAGNAVHRLLMKISGGRIGGDIGGMPVIELTTTGRKSGKKRSTLLTVPWKDGNTLAVVASAGGNEDHPAWYLNLKDNPSVTVGIDAGSMPMIARIAEGDERSKVWAELSSKYTNYADYQAKTDREIPVVLLEPTS